MEKKKQQNVLKRVMAIALSLLLAFSGFQLTGLRAQAADFNFNNCISDVTVYQSGCLKSMKVKIVPEDDNYAPAYGKIAVHSKKSQYSWDKKYLSVGQSNWNQVSDDSLKTNDGLLAWSSGEEFKWTDWNSSTNNGSNVVSVEFSDGQIDLKQDATYYIHLWTRSDRFGIYPDGLIGTISAGNGKLKYGEGGQEIEIIKIDSVQVILDNQNATTAGTQTVDAVPGAAMPKITPPAKTGYTFGGYFTEKNGSGTKYYNADGTSARAHDASVTKLYAKWTANTYTVKYNGNKPASASSNVSGSTAESSHTYDTAKKLTTNGFSLTGWSFDGWNTNADGTGTSYADGASVKNLTSTAGGTVSLYAVWKIQAAIKELPTAKTDLQYTGTPKPLVDAGSVAAPEHSKVQYSLNANGPWSYEVPSVSDAGKYQVYYKAVSTSDDYADGPVSETPVEVTIEKAPVKVTPKSGQFKEYGYDDPELTYDVEGLQNNETAEQAVTPGTKLSREVGETVTDEGYAINAGDLSFKNYSIEEFTSGVVFKIIKRSAPTEIPDSAKPTATNPRYTGASVVLAQPPAAFATEPMKGYRIKYKVDDGEWTDDIDSVTAATSGKHTVYYTYEADENHKPFETIFELTSKVTVAATVTDAGNNVKEFGTFAEAASEWGSNGGKLTLLENVSAGSTINLTKPDNTLDLNGHTLTGPSSGDLINLAAGGSAESPNALTIKDGASNGGKIVNNGIGDLIEAGSNTKVTIESGEISNSNGDIVNGGANSGVKVDIKGGTVNNTTGNIVKAGSGAEINITAGTVTNTGDDITNIGGNSSVTISGGDVTNTGGSIVDAGTNTGIKVAFSGGDIKNSGDFAVITGDNADVDLTGGTLEAVTGGGIKVGGGNSTVDISGSNTSIKALGAAVTAGSGATVSLEGGTVESTGGKAFDVAANTNVKLLGASVKTADGQNAIDNGNITLGGNIDIDGGGISLPSGKQIHLENGFDPASPVKISVEAGHNGYFLDNDSTALFTSNNYTKLEKCFAPSQSGKGLDFDNEGKPVLNPCTTYGGITVNGKPLNSLNIGRLLEIDPNDPAGQVAWNNDTKTLTINADKEIPSGIEINVPSGVTLLIPSGKTLTNKGTITGDGTVKAEGTLNNEGTIKAPVDIPSGGILNNNEGGTLSGEVSNQTGGTLNNNAGGNITGNVTNAGGFTNAGTIKGNAAVTNSGNMTNSGNINGNASVNNSGTLTNNGTIGGAGTVTNSGSGEITNNGTINTTGKVTNESGAKITNEVGKTINSPVDNSGTIINKGTLAGTVANTGVNGKITNEIGGKIEGSLSNSAGGEITNNGTISGDLSSTGAGSKVTNEVGGTLSGNVANTNGSGLNNKGTISGNGKTVNNSGTLTNDGEITSSGGVNNTGTLTNNADKTIEAPGNNSGNGTVTNNGTLAGDVSNTGGGDINNNGTISGGITNSGNGSTINNETTGTISGKLTNSDKGIINNKGTISGDITNSGERSKISNGQNAEISGKITNSDKGEIENEGIISGDLTSSGNGSKVNNALGGKLTGNVTNNTGSTFNNNGEINGNEKTLNNSGTLVNASGTEISVPVKNTNGGIVNNNGTISGDITNTGTGSKVNNNSGASLSGKVTNGNGGIINNKADITGAVTNQTGAVIDNKSGGAISGDVDNEGVIIKDGGNTSGTVTNKGTAAVITPAAGGVTVSDGKITMPANTQIETPASGGETNTVILPAIGDATFTVPVDKVNKLSVDTDETTTLPAGSSIMKNSVKTELSYGGSIKQDGTITVNVAPPAPPTPPSGGGGGSTGGGSGGTESYTIPVTNESTVNVKTEITDGTAVVGEITQKDIDKIVDTGSDSGSGGENTSITIDVSQAKSEVTSVELSKETTEKLAATTQADNNVDRVEIKMSNATVELDGAALSAISEQAEGSSIKLVVEGTNTSKLNESQQESLKQFASSSPFEAYFESDGNRIHDFKGGTARVSLKFTPEAGRSLKHYHVYYLSLAGAIERFVTYYANGLLSFVTSHFSDYAIVYDEEMENGGEFNPEDPVDLVDPEDPVKIMEMHRLYNPNSGEHFYTADVEERDYLVEVGWNYEGVAWYAPEESEIPVYRLYNSNAGDHHYTMDIEERDDLIAEGWNDEGIGWYSVETEDVPLYRLYNPNALEAGAHHYTADAAERDHLVEVGWSAEGLAWYGMDEEKAKELTKQAS